MQHGLDGGSNVLRQFLPGLDQGGKVGVLDGKLAKQSPKTGAPSFAHFAATALWF